MSHPNPQAEYGENEIGTPLKPSERIEEIKEERLQKVSREYIETTAGMITSARVGAIIQYLDEQHAKSGIIS